VRATAAVIRLGVVSRVLLGSPITDTKQEWNCKWEEKKGKDEEMELFPLSTSPRPALAPISL
jgi:hypothetical protein